MQIQPSGSLRLEISASVSDTIDYANNQPAEQLLVSPAFEAKIGRHINVSFEHNLQRLDVEGGELFEANLSQLHLIYNFSARMFARGIWQWLDLERDPDLYSFEVEPKTETLFTQLLFSYKVNARHVPVRATCTPLYRGSRPAPLPACSAWVTAKGSHPLRRLPSLSPDRSPAPSPCRPA